MAKKKKVKQAPVATSPESYLKKGSARKLPIHKCLVPENWEELKKFPVIVAREHVNGNVTFANLLVDLLCTGVKDAMYEVNMPMYEFEELIDRYDDIEVNLKAVDYNLVHNLIFESLAYAEDFGIAPHPDFRYAEMILEEDSDDIPLMDIPMGENGKAVLLLVNGDSRNNYYRTQLEKNAEPGSYEIINDPFGAMEDDWTDEWDDELD